MLDAQTGEMLASCVDRVSILWPDEDSGMWEVEKLRHHTGAKLAVWIALDRALGLAEAGQLPDAHAAQWREQRGRLHTWIEERCWSEELGAYQGCAGEKSLDAAVLRAVRMGYPEQERLGRTVDAIRERLSAAPGLLYRTTEHVGKEGAFVACSFCAAEALHGSAASRRPTRRWNRYCRTPTTSASSRRRSIQAAASSLGTFRKASAILR